MFLKRTRCTPPAGNCTSSSSSRRCSSAGASRPRQPRCDRWHCTPHIDGPRTFRPPPFRKPTRSRVYIARHGLIVVVHDAGCSTGLCRRRSDASRWCGASSHPRRTSRREPVAYTDTRPRCYGCVECLPYARRVHLQDCTTTMATRTAAWAALNSRAAHARNKRTLGCKLRQCVFQSWPGCSGWHLDQGPSWRHHLLADARKNSTHGHMHMHTHKQDAWWLSCGIPEGCRALIPP